MRPWEAMSLAVLWAATLASTVVGGLTSSVPSTPDDPAGWLGFFGVMAPTVAVAYWLLQRSDRLTEKMAERHDRSHSNDAELIRELRDEIAALRTRLDDEHE